MNKKKKFTQNKTKARLVISVKGIMTGLFHRAQDITNFDESKDDDQKIMKKGNYRKSISKINVDFVLQIVILLDFRSL